MLNIISLNKCTSFTLKIRNKDFMVLRNSGLFHPRGRALSHCTQLMKHFTYYINVFFHPSKYIPQFINKFIFFTFLCFYFSIIYVMWFTFKSLRKTYQWVNCKNILSIISTWNISSIHLLHGYTLLVNAVPPMPLLKWTT